MKSLAMVFIVLLVSGCAATGEWVSSSKTQQQTKLDAYECRADGERYAANLGFGGNPIIAADRSNECMSVRGYTWKKY